MIPVSVDTLTEEQIRYAQGQWPEQITSELAANALGLPYDTTLGGLPIFYPMSVVWQARSSIVILLNREAEAREKAAS